jgi:DNA transformation protein and related proteins
MPSRLPPDNYPVSALRNLGPKSAAMLAEAGIRTIGELREIGAVKAYVRVRTFRSRGASLNLLWSMAAGLEDRGWQDLSKDEKNALRADLRQLRR